jgi:mono/diheme cytochrome c family protein
MKVRLCLPGLAGAGCAAALLLALAAGCAVHVTNLQAREAAAPPATPGGSVYLGWRVYQDRCARCHGSDATGTDRGADLRPRVAGMSPRRFVNLVLRRYDWGSARDNEGLADDVLARREEPLAMPAWEGEPRVGAHILDLYAYLAARAEGALGPGRPPRAP